MAVLHAAHGPDAGADCRARSARSSQASCIPKRAKVGSREDDRRATFTTRGGAEQAAEDFERRSRGDVPDRSRRAADACRHARSSICCSSAGWRNRAAKRRAKCSRARCGSTVRSSPPSDDRRSRRHVPAAGRRRCSASSSSPRASVCHEDPEPVGRGWIIMQNKGQVDIVHSSRETRSRGARSRAGVAQPFVRVRERATRGRCAACVSRGPSAESALEVERS